jgi:LmbE family N-acetylglucosaminyl deacetylase
MKLSMPAAEVFIPDAEPESQALARTTHLAVAAHQDDIEIMAFDGIQACFQQPDKWFSGVVTTNGSGSPRDGLYRDYTDTAMMAVRRKEQRKAAMIGEYAAIVELDHTSSVIKDAAQAAPVMDLAAVLDATRPEVVYTHTLTDKHDTHVAVALRLITALRKLPRDIRPVKLYGCEVWRDLDWMVETDKVVFDVSARENLQAALLGVFDSQICGGKRYDLATLGRRHAHATYQASHGVDRATGVTFAMDLSPLLMDDTLDPATYALAFIDRFRHDVAGRIDALK